MFRVTGLGRIIQAGPGPLGLAGPLVLQPAVQGLSDHLLLLLLLLLRPRAAAGLEGAPEPEFRVFRRVPRLPSRFGNLPVQRPGRCNDADRQVPQTSGVVSEVEAKSSVDVVHQLPCQQQAKLGCPNTEVDVPPATHLPALGVWRLDVRFGPGPLKRLVQGGGKCPVGSRHGAVRLGHGSDAVVLLGCMSDLQRGYTS